MVDPNGVRISRSSTLSGTYTPLIDVPATNNIVLDGQVVGSNYYKLAYLNLDVDGNVIAVGEETTAILQVVVDNPELPVFTTGIREVNAEMQMPNYANALVLEHSADGDIWSELYRGTSTTYRFTAFTDSKYIRIKGIANNSIGNLSEVVEYVQPIVDTPILSVVQDGGSAVLVWTPSNGLVYEVYASNVLIATIEDTSYRVDTIVNTSFQIKAVNGFIETASNIFNYVYVPPILELIDFTIGFDETGNSTPSFKFTWVNPSQLRTTLLTITFKDNLTVDGVDLIKLLDITSRTNTIKPVPASVYEVPAYTSNILTFVVTLTQGADTLETIYTKQIRSSKYTTPGGGLKTILIKDNFPWVEQLHFRLKGAGGGGGAVMSEEDDTITLYNKDLYGGHGGYNGAVHIKIEGQIATSLCSLGMGGMPSPLRGAPNTMLMASGGGGGSGGSNGLTGGIDTVVYPSLISQGGVRGNRDPEDNGVWYSSGSGAAGGIGGAIAGIAFGGNGGHGGMLFKVLVYDPNAPIEHLEYQLGSGGEKGYALNPNMTAEYVDGTNGEDGSFHLLVLGAVND